MTLVKSIEEVFAKKRNLTDSHPSWKRVELAQVTKLVNGFPFKSVLFNTDNGFPIVRIRDISKGFTKTFYTGEVPEEYVIDSGDYLIGMDGNFRCYEWMGGKAGLNQRVCKIEANETYLLNRFLLYGINGYLFEIENATSAVTVNHLSSIDILKIPFPLPPLAEQQRIVEKLDAILPRLKAVKARLDKIPTILKRFRQSVLAAACSGKLTEEWRELHQDVVNEIDIKVVDSHSFDFPEEWKVSVIKHACQSIDCGSTPKGKPFTDKGEVPFLKVYNIVGQKIAFDYRPQFVTKAIQDKELKRSKCYPNDILMNIVGPPLGKIAIVTGQFTEWNINQAIVVFRVSAMLDYRFLYYWLCSLEPIKEIINETRGSAGQANISLNQCRNLLVPLPVIDEQQEIVKQVEKLFDLADSLEAKYKAAIKHIDKLEQAVLAKAFRGELAAQDPDDEPAEVLLERILKEKATIKKKTRS